jgi:hypothetical protein
MLAPEDPATVLLGQFALADGAGLGHQAVPSSGELAVTADGRVALAIDFYGEITGGAETFSTAGGSDLLIGPFTVAEQP